MANTVVKTRQYPLNALCKLGIANIGAGNGFDIVLPPGTVLNFITADTLTAFDGTTNTLTVDDGTTTFIAAQDVKTAGRETVAVASKRYPNGGTIHVTMAQTGAATVGEADVQVDYVVEGRANEPG